MSRRWRNDLTRTNPSSSRPTDRKSTRLNSSHSQISYAVFCLKKKKKTKGYNILASDLHAKLPIRTIVIQPLTYTIIINGGSIHIVNGRYISLHTIPNVTSRPI